MPKKTPEKTAQQPQEISPFTPDPRKTLALAIEHGWDVLVAGACGAGKTYLAREVGESLGRPVEIFYLGGVFDGEAFVQGRTVLDMGQTRFCPSRFCEAIQKPGTVIIIDELNRAPWEVPNALLSLTDHQRSMALDLADTQSRVVERASGVVFIATANIGPEYVGALPIDPALEDRMMRVQVGYPPIERDLLREGGLSSDKADELMTAAAAIRAQYDRGGIACSLSTRALLRTGSMIVLGFSLESALLSNVHLYAEADIAAFVATVRSAS